MKDLGLVARRLERKGFKREPKSRRGVLEFQRMQGSNLLIGCEYDLRKRNYSFNAIPRYNEDVIPARLRRDVQETLDRLGVRARIDGDPNPTLEEVRTKLGLDSTISIGYVYPVVKYGMRIKVEDTDFKRGYSAIVRALKKLGYEI